jgi:hypothetical protein
VEEQRRRRAGAVVAAACLSLGLGMPPPAGANAESLTPEQVRDITADVLAGEAFAGSREVQHWVFVGDGPDQDLDRLPEWLRALLEYTGRGADLVAAPVKWLLILLAAVALALVLRQILIGLPAGGRGKPTAPPVSELPHLVEPDNPGLPADVPAAARTLIASGGTRAALALLYRASLERVARRHTLEIPESATETECLVIAAGTRHHAEAELLRRLTRAWQRTAYAHRSPSAAELDTLLRDWQGEWNG